MKTKKTIILFLKLNLKNKKLCSNITAARLRGDKLICRKYEEGILRLLMVKRMNQTKKHCPKYLMKRKSCDHVVEILLS